MERFFQRHHDIGFHIASPLRFATTLAKIAAKARLSAAAEKSFEEIAETGPAEFEIDPTAVARRRPAKSATRLRAPTRRWLKPATRLVPISPKLVILPALLRISEDLVGFVDLFELF